jgi:DNA replication protein DnaC
MEMFQTIGQILQENPQLNSSVKCEKCKRRPKYRDNEGLRKWCKRCIDIYYRAEKMTDEKLERELSNLVEPLYVNAQLSDFDEEIQKIVTSLGDNDMFFWGTVGTGKTYLMAAVLRHYYKLGYTCARINFDDFCVLIRSSMTNASKVTEWDLIEPLKNVDILAIDDLGLRSKLETDFAYVTLYSLLNKRQEKMLPTIISSNKSIEQLGQAFDARIASRLQLAIKIQMTGKDRRKS